MPTQLTVSRASSKDIQLRHIAVKLDNEVLGTLKFGEHLTRAIAPGRHRLQADNTFQKKALDLEVREGEHVRFQVVNRAGRLSWFIIFALGSGPVYLTLEPVAVASFQPPPNAL